MFTSKLPHVGTTIFTVMSGLSAQYQAINLSQGFPDFPCSDELIDRIHRYMKDGYNQYAPMAGVMPLREQIAEKLLDLYGFAANPDTEITITSGGTEALYAAITAVVQKGDEVIVFEPAYDSYAPAIELNGGKMIALHLEYPDFQISIEKLQAAISPRTRMIVLNTPHNPTGSTLKAEIMQKIADLVRNTPILILSDEVYEHLIYDQQKHQSVWRFPELRDRSMAVYSFGKTFHATGWKIGYCVAPSALSAEFRKVHQSLTFSTHTPTQYALADYMKQKENYLQLPDFYQKKRDFFANLLRNSSFRLLPSEGTYFQLADYSLISQEKDTDFAIRLTKEIGVATIPVSVFYSDLTDHRLIRFCFAKKEDTLAKAAEKLGKL